MGRRDARGSACGRGDLVERSFDAALSSPCVKDVVSFCERCAPRKRDGAVLFFSFLMVDGQSASLIFISNYKCTYSLQFTTCLVLRFTIL